MYIETGSAAPPDKNNAINMAAADINAAGGIDGHQLQVTPYDVGILPQQAVTAAQQAIAAHPTIIIGFPVSSGVQAAASILKQSGIPVLQTGGDDSTDLSKTGVTNMFRIIATASMDATGQASYALTRHPHTVGLFDDSDLNAHVQLVDVQAQLKAKGVTNIIYREVAQNATDTTAAALAMKPADIIISGGFPQLEALFVKQLSQNGINTQDVMSYGSTDTVAFGLAPKDVLAHDALLSICEPDALTSSQAKQYVTEYRSKYSTPSLSSNPYFYDSLYLLQAAVKQANGSLDPKALVSALGQVTYTGVCGTYHADSQNNMFHQVQVVSAGNPAQTLGLYQNLSS